MHVPIIGTHNCGNKRKDALKCRSEFQYLLCHHDYVERIVDRFAHRIQSEYYSANRSVSIQGIALEEFSATD